MGIKDALLNRGWAGRTMTRQETAARLNPLIRQHAALNHAYRHALGRADDPALADPLAALLKTSRTDVGKLKETVFSAGATAYNATDLAPEDYALDAEAPLADLQKREQQFQDALSDEKDENHQMRTRAILAVVRTNSRARLDVLQQHLRERASARASAAG